MTIFYAYVNNIEDDNTWRLVLIFQDSGTADEWWRAVSGGVPLLKDLGVKRISPELYTHKANSVFNLYTFFYDTRITDIANPFRGRIRITLDNDRGGRGISIVPSQNVTDLVSGNWFYIRSKPHSSSYWYFDRSAYRVYASDTKRTLFCVTAQNLPQKTIMIGSDMVSLVVAPDLDIGINDLGNLVGGKGWNFLFSDLADGRFVINDTAGTLIFENVDAGSPKKEGWELVR